MELMPGPLVLYHLTDSSRLDGIQSHGLLPSRSREPRGRPRGVYFSQDEGHARAYEDHHGDWTGAPVLLRVQVAALDEALLAPDDVDLPDLLDEGRSLGDVSWKESLALSGQCVCRAPVPAAAIEFERAPGIGFEQLLGADLTWTRRLRANRVVDRLLRAISKTEFRDRILVFGSVAAGMDTPGDLDIAVDVRDVELKFDDRALRPYSGLLHLARRHYGWFDPFVMFGDHLIVRDAEARGWTSSRSSGPMRRAILEAGVPLKEVMRRRALANTRAAPESETQPSTGTDASIEPAGLGHVGAGHSQARPALARRTP